MDNQPVNKPLTGAVKIVASIKENRIHTFSDEPIDMILEALKNCDHRFTFGTDEVIEDKAMQLAGIFKHERYLDVKKADAFIETMFRLITQREKEAAYKASR
jgi:hypothetical protein